LVAVGKEIRIATWNPRRESDLRVSQPFSLLAPEIIVAPEALARTQSGFSGFNASAFVEQSGSWLEF
jgi:hypothetical protein